MSQQEEKKITAPIQTILPEFQISSLCFLQISYQRGKVVFFLFAVVVLESIPLPDITR